MVGAGCTGEEPDSEKALLATLTLEILRTTSKPAV